MLKLVIAAIVMLSLGLSGQGQTVNLNYSSTAPAAPAGSTNITWQHDKSSPINISAYIHLPSTSGVGAPISVCSSTVSNGYFYLSDTLGLYQCSNVVGGVYGWNLLPSVDSTARTSAAAAQTTATNAASSAATALTNAATAQTTASAALPANGVTTTAGGGMQVVTLTAGTASHTLVSGSGVTYPDSTVQATKGLLPTNNLADVASSGSARSNITAAKSGANADITALSGLTTPLTPAQGGAGAMTGAPAWLRFFGDGSQGAYSCATGTCGLNALESWYSSFNVSAGATFSPPNGNGAQTIIRSTGPCTIAGTITVSPNTDSNAYGSTGTTTTYGGAGGGGGGGTAAGSAGPGAINAGNTPAGIAGGGAGGNGITTVATYFRNLIAEGYAWYMSGSLVALGGQQGGAGGSSGPAGGKGSNPFILVCPSISFTGTIDASGAPGNPSTANNMGASGGGGGGVVILSAETYPAYTGTILLSGGAGGSCGAYTGCGAGGTGGNGNSYKATIQ
jgi:hypothetical protein